MLTPEEKRERVRLKNKAWREANPEQVQAQNKKWYEANREQSLARNKAWRAANREANLAQRKGYREANVAELKAALVTWREANRGRSRGYAATRRARKLAAFVEAVDRAAIYERDNGICQLCGYPIGYEKWHVDHCIPLSKGGEHSYANCQLAHAVCNQAKSARVPA